MQASIPMVGFQNDQQACFQVSLFPKFLLSLFVKGHSYGMGLALSTSNFNPTR